MIPAKAARRLLGNGKRTAMCTQCRCVFTGMSAFDAHQRADPDDAGRVWCVPPASVGLERKPSGRWGSAERRPVHLTSLRRE